MCVLTSLDIFSHSQRVLNWCVFILQGFQGCSCWWDYIWILDFTVLSSKKIPKVDHHACFTLRPECNLLDCFVLKRWRCPIRGRLKTWENIQNKNMEWKFTKLKGKKTENYKSTTCISWSQNKKRLSNLWGSGISWKLRWLNVFSFWDESTFPFFETTPRASTKR